jgi:hypothetical protein
VTFLLLLFLQMSVYHTLSPVGGVGSVVGGVDGVGSNHSCINLPIYLFGAGG